MRWCISRWTWRLESPLYVGTTPAGALNRCRLYVPARALWGALTAELVRSEEPGTADVANRYRTVGEELQRDYRFTYLFPAQAVQGKWQAWLPIYKPGRGLAWRREADESSVGLIPERLFRRRLLHTRAATAIEPQSDAAAEGSLRETECIQPRWRDEDGSDSGAVAFVGYVFTRESSDASGSEIERLNPIRSLFVGGDTRYGLGRLERISCEPAEPANRVFGQSVETGGADPVVQSPIVLAHASPEAEMLGGLEVLSGWDVGSQEGVDDHANPLWVPGSCVAKPDRRVPFRIDELGIWRFENHDA